MGRGRTTTGMVAACLIATVAQDGESAIDDIEAEDEDGDMEDSLATEAGQYLAGEYKTILQLVTVLSHGKR